MDLDDGMLFDANSSPDPHEESLTATASTLWATSDEYLDITLTDHPAAHDEDPTGSQWLDEDLFAETEDTSMCELDVSADALADSSSRDKERVISDIESVFDSMLDVLLTSGDSLVLFLKSRSLAQTTGVARSRLIRFPGKTAEEAWRFSMCLGESNINLH